MVLPGVRAGHQRHRSAAATVTAAAYLTSLLRGRPGIGRFRDRPAEAQGRRGGRPPTVDDNVLAVAHARQARGESVTAIARHRKIGRSTLCRALQLREGDLASAAVEPAR
jgi:hypothetical protein